MGFINKTGKVVISIKYEEVHYFNNGLSDVKYQGKYGYIDKNGVEYWEWYGDIRNNRFSNCNFYRSFWCYKVDNQKN